MSWHEKNMNDTNSLSQVTVKGEIWFSFLGYHLATEVRKELFITDLKK